MMRWALAAGDFTPLGGMDRANYALARYLALSGRDVHLVAHRVWPDLASLRNITIHHASRPLGSHLMGGPLLALQASATARRLGPAARLLSNGGNARWRGPTWIHYLHAAYAPDTAEPRARMTARAGRKRFLASEADAIARAPAVICNSERTAEDVRCHYNVPAEKIRVVYYGTDAAQFGAISEDARREARASLNNDARREARGSLNNDARREARGSLNNDARREARASLNNDVCRPLAMFIGALGDRRKGFDILFDAWQELCRDASWDADLAVVGTGAEVASWQRRAVEQGLEGRISFLGFRDDVPRLLAAADVLVHPARYEAYGLGVHEGLCRGIPAIVSAIAGVAERLPPELRPLTLPLPLASKDLVDRFRLWHSDDAGWRQRAKAFGAVLRRRSWDDMAVEVAGIVEQL